MARHRARGSTSDVPGHQQGWTAARRAAARALIGEFEPALFVLLGAVGVRPADRLRQRRQPAARARDGAAARDGGARRARRQPRPARAAAADREPVLASRAAARPGARLGARRACASSPPSALPIAQLELVAIDGWALSFTVAASLLSGVLFGLAPALQAARACLKRVVERGGRTDRQRAALARAAPSWSSRSRSRSCCWSAPGCWCAASRASSTFAPAFYPEDDHDALSLPGQIPGTIRQAVLRPFLPGDRTRFRACRPPAP